MFEDWLAINALLVAYTHGVDGARWEEVAALFEHATYRLEHADSGAVSTYQGSAPVLGFCRQTIVHADGTPRTKHLLSNVDIALDGDVARASSYVTVLQQVDDLPLQPIPSGRYLDRFERVGGAWRFAERTLTGFLLGDRSRHIAWNEGTPS